MKYVNNVPVMYKQYFWSSEVDSKQQTESADNMMNSIQLCGNDTRNIIVPD